MRILYDNLGLRDLPTFFLSGDDLPSTVNFFLQKLESSCSPVAIYDKEIVGRDIKAQDTLLSNYALPVAEGTSAEAFGYSEHAVRMRGNMTDGKLFLVASRERIIRQDDLERMRQNMR